MKEFDYDFKDVFNGLNPKKVSKKDVPSLNACHNLEPLGDDYQVHEEVIDMNVDAYDWGNA